jgi:2,3-bisphosphoglycerate-independent phosphoglycerate mutase
VVIDHAASGLRPAESRELLATVQRAWESEAPDLARRLRVVSGVGHRAVVIDSSGESYNGVTTVSPPNAVGRSWLRCLPTGDRADALRRLMEIAHDVLPHHEINLARIDRGERPANMLWLWGAGGAMRCTPLQEMHGVRAAMVASSTVASGVARLTGIDRIAAPGVTAEAEADLSAIGEYAASAVDRYDVVIAHVAAPDKAAHRRDAIGKTRAIEEADEQVIGPLLRKLQTYGDAEQSTSDSNGVGWRMLVVVDHISRCADGAHATGSTPFVLAGAWVRKVLDLPFTEMGATESDLQVDPGFELMEYALYSSLKVARRIRRPSERGVS